MLARNARRLLCDAPWWLHVSRESHWNCCLTAVATPFIHSFNHSLPAHVLIRIGFSSFLPSWQTIPSRQHRFGLTARESEAPVTSAPDDDTSDRQQTKSPARGGN